MTDFGFAKQCFDAEKHRVILSTTFWYLRTKCFYIFKNLIVLFLLHSGTLPYECPQILEHKPYDAFKADCW